MPVEYGSKFEDYYLPSYFDFTDYPDLVAKGERIPTIAVPTVLTAYNWRANSDRYRRVARFVDDLFSRVNKLVADRTARILMVGECTKAFPKVMKFWLEALEATATYEENGRKVYKDGVQDQFEAAKCIMEYGFGRPVQPLTGAFQEQTHRTLEVRWMPPRPDDRSKAVDLAPGE